MAEVAAEVQRSRSCSFIPSLPRANHHHLLSLSSSHHLTTVAPTPFQPLSSPYVPSTKNMRYQVESTIAEGRREWTLDEIDAEWNETTKQSESWARQVADIPLCTIYPRAEIETFIIQIGLALQANGMPAHLLEYHLDRFTEAAGIECRMFISPIGTFYYFEGAEPGAPHTYLVTPTNTGLNFDNILLLSKLMYRVVRKEINIADAHQVIKKIEKRKPRYGLLLAFLAWTLGPIAVTFFFRGGVREMCVVLQAAIVSWCIACIPQTREASPGICAFFSVMIAYLYHLFVWRINVLTAGIAGCIMFVPGLNLGTAMIELGKGQLVSGTVRLVAAISTELQLTYGIILGATVMDYLFSVDHSPLLVEPLSPYFFPLFATLGGLGYCVSFQAGPSVIPIALVSAAIGGASSAWIIPAFGRTLGPLIGSTILALMSNLYARLVWPHVSLVALLPGIIMMVPGAMGVNALFTLSLVDPESGLIVMLAVFFTAIQLAIAIVIANAIIPLPSVPWRASRLRTVPLEKLATLRVLLGNPSWFSNSMTWISTPGNVMGTKTVETSEKSSLCAKTGGTAIGSRSGYGALGENTPLLPLSHPALSPERSDESNMV